jgi:hypothetical protein
MPQVVPQGDCLGQVFVEVQGPSYSASYLGDLEGVGEACHIVVTLRDNKNLRLMLEAAEGLRMDDAVTVALKGSAYRTGLFIFKPASRVLTFYGIGREAFFPFFNHPAYI